MEISRRKYGSEAAQRAVLHFTYSGDGKHSYRALISEGKTFFGR